MFKKESVAEVPAAPSDADRIAAIEQRLAELLGPADVSIDNIARRLLGPERNDPSSDPDVVLSFAQKLQLMWVHSTARQRLQSKIIEMERERFAGICLANWPPWLLTDQDHARVREQRAHDQKISDQMIANEKAAAQERRERKESRERIYG